jgi:hypothetical protein
LRQQPIIEFSGGINNATPDHMVMPNELKRANNCLWDSGLIQREGYTLSQTIANCAVILGEYEHTLYRDEAHLMVAYENSVSGLLEVWFRDAVIFTSPSGWNVTNRVRFAGVDNTVLMVNSNDEVVVFTWNDITETFSWELMDDADIRTRNELDVYLGAYDDSQAFEADKIVDISSFDFIQITDPETQGAELTVGMRWQRTSDYSVFEWDGAAWQPYDQEVWNNTYSGMVVSCDYIFNRITFNFTLTGTAPTLANIYYWSENADNWVALTVTETPTWTTGASDLAWNIPIVNGQIDMAYCTEPYPIASNRFAIKIEFTATDPADSLVVDSLVVQHDEYFSMITNYEAINDIAIYNSTYIAAAGNTIHFSPFLKATGWRSNEIEYCADGGDRILRVMPVQGGIVVLKENGIHLLFGNYKALSRRFYTTKGPVNPDAAVIHNDILYMISEEGLMRYDGASGMICSKHIDMTLSNPQMYEDVEFVYIINDDGTGYVFDPDTYKTLPNGDARVNIFAFEYADTIYRHAGELNRYGIASDTIYAFDGTTTDNGTPITFNFRSANLSLSHFGILKRYARFKPLLRPAGVYTVALTADKDRYTASVQIDSGVTGETYLGYETMPYQLDGYDLSVEFTNATANVAAVYGFVFDYEKGEF